MGNSLTGKVCTPCLGGTPPLSPTEAQDFQQQTPKWDLTDSATWIRRSFGFDNFVGALDFVNKVGALAEDEGHHPDFALGWGYVDISLQTHKIRGLHENDFILAAKIDAIA
jgi:4a-hydroxytetrahydrobiopterin dehydratase